MMITFDKIVLCFDRDYTISVNECPHDDHEQVPLSWVKYYHNDCDTIDVWATGNQKLVGEASIPGVKAARYIHRKQNGYPTDEFDDINHDLHSYEPSRREGLRLIKDCYENAGLDCEYYVVDDVNLQDMESEGWDYFSPDDFVQYTKIIDPYHRLAVPDDNPYTDTSVESKACSMEMNIEIPGVLR